jgi:hypothetical protein
MADERPDIHGTPGAARPGAGRTSETSPQTGRAAPPTSTTAGTTAGATSVGTTTATAPRGGVEVRGEASYRPADDSIAAPLGFQRITWGPIWAGAVVFLTSYLALELMLFAVGAREIDVDAAIDENAAITAIAAIVAMFLGGLIAGVTQRWTSPVEGMFHGMLVWALAIVAFLTLTVLGAGLALGGVGTAAGEIGLDVNQLATDAGEEFDAAQIADDAETAAQVAVVVIGLMLLAAIGGGAAGSRVGAERRARQLYDIEQS